MAVPVQTPFVEYIANGVTTNFPLGFDCETQSHLIVTVDDIEPITGSWSLLVDAVVFNSAPITGSKIIIKRNSPFERDRDFQLYDQSFRPPAVNLDLDRIWRKLQELGVMDWLLSNRIDDLKNYVDDRDDELRAYLLEEIRKQGVALDQLEDYYNYLMQRLAEIAVDKGWDASFVVDGDETQHEINNKIRASADSNARLTGNVLDYFTKSELEAWKANQENFDASDAIIRAQVMSKSNEITFPTGTFRITKKIPSPKHWVGVYGGYDPYGTLILVDNAIAIDGVIDVTANSTDIKLQGIFFKGVQNRLHTLYKSKNGYIVRHKSLRVDSFAYGFVSKGTYDFFDDCYFNDNAVGIKPVAFNSTNQSTMFGYRNCVFTYNAKAFDVSQTDGFGSYEDWMNILFESCGFEANEYGIYSPQRMWYVTLLNCWFENNSAYGLYSPTSHVLEINTRHNANSPRLVNEPTTSTLLGMTASFVDLEIKGDIKFPAEYSSTGAAAKGKTISQTFTDDGGSVVAEIAFVREQNSNIYGGSGIEFSTAISTTSPDLIPRWGVNQFGVLYPKQDVLYNIGSPTNRCKAVFTASIMYTDTCGDFVGSGSPEGVVSASPGSTYRRTDGNTPCFYVKESGVGSTGWVAK